MLTGLDCDPCDDQTSVLAPKPFDSNPIHGFTAWVDSVRLRGSMCGGDASAQANFYNDRHIDHR